MHLQPKITMGPPPKRNGYDIVALDLEIWNLNQDQLHRPAGQFGCLSICGDGRQVFIVANPADVETALTRLDGAVFVFHNASFDVPHLRRWADFEDRKSGEFWDTLIVERILWSGHYDNFELADLARRYLDVQLNKSVGKAFHKSDSCELTDELIQYAAEDVATTWRIQRAQESFLSQDPQSRRVWEWIDAPAFWALEQFKGFRLNLKKWNELAANSSREADRLRNILGFNPASPKQTLSALAEKGIHLTSSNADLLEHYRDDPLVAKVLAFREANKLATTYGRDYSKFVEADKRVYPKFITTGALTGRLACRDPNLQNLPSKKEFRECFEAAPGNRIVKADYASQEPRISAALSGDKHMLEIFERGESIHLQAARKIFGHHVQKGDPEYRRAKAFVLGSSYGLTPQGFAAREEIPVEEAERIAADFFRSFPGMASYMAKIRNEGQRNGEVRTMGGRRIWINNYNRLMAANGPLNFPCQGTGSDIIKRAMTRLYEATGKDLPLVATVHDELVAEVRMGDARKTAKLIQFCMEEGFRDVVGDKVRGEVEVAIGRSWAG